MGMYLRRVCRKNKDGSEVAYLQLAHNEWDPVTKYAKAKVIYSFGREDQVDLDALRRLVDSISRYLSQRSTEDSEKKRPDGEPRF